MSRCATRVPLAFAQLVTGKISQAIVSRVFIHFRKRRIVKNQLDERIDRAAGFNHRRSQMDQFRRAFADHVHAEQFLVGAEDEFQQSG